MHMHAATVGQRRMLTPANLTCGLHLQTFPRAQVPGGHKSAAALFLCQHDKSTASCAQIMPQEVSAIFVPLLFISPSKTFQSTACRAASDCVNLATWPCELLLHCNRPILQLCTRCCSLLPCAGTSCRPGSAPAGLPKK